jgi:plasmid maintenance system killer protein
MSRIIDQRLVEIHAARTIPDLPADLCQLAYRQMRYLLAARAWADLDIFTRVADLADGRFAVPVQGKWVIVFAWTEGLGASELSLLRI